MTDKLLCPFCQQELNDNYYICCNNPHCNETADMFGTEELWQALIDTKKKLDIANGNLTYMIKKYIDASDSIITQINQKEQQ